MHTRGTLLLFGLSRLASHYVIERHTSSHIRALCRRVCLLFNVSLLCVIHAFMRMSAEVRTVGW